MDCITFTTIPSTERSLQLAIESKTVILKQQVNNGQPKGLFRRFKRWVRRVFRAKRRHQIKEPTIEKQNNHLNEVSEYRPIGPNTFAESSDGSDGNADDTEPTHSDITSSMKNLIRRSDEFLTKSDKGSERTTSLLTHRLLTESTDSTYPKGIKLCASVMAVCVDTLRADSRRGVRSVSARRSDRIADSIHAERDQSSRVSTTQREDRRDINHNNDNDFDWKAFAKELNLETNHPLVVDNPLKIYASIFRSVHTLAANNITLGQFLGVGGFGSVISGTKDGLQLAIKFDFSSDEELVITKVRDILDVTRVITHSNVIQFFSLGPRSAIFAMERADTDLYDYVRQHLMYDKEKPEIRMRTALDLFNQMIEGVAHIHSLGFAHQDLKPPNIVIIEDNTNNTTRLRAKITDFDTLLQCVDPSTGKPLPCYPFHATSIYAAPEVLASKYTIASYQSSLRPTIADIRRQDVYSIGMTLVFMLSGYEPWIFDDEVEAEVDWRLDIMSRPQQMTDTISHFPYINGYDMGLKALLLDFLCPEPTTRITLETYRTNQRFAKFRDRLIGFKTYDRKDLVRRPIQNSKFRKNRKQKLGFSRLDATIEFVKT